MNGHSGYRHSAAFYGSEDELRAEVVSYVEEGVAAGDQVLVVLGAPQEAIVREALGDADDVAFAPAGELYHRPADTVAHLLGLLRAFATDLPGRRLRVVGAVADIAATTDWEPWARYEAAINHIYAPYPATGLCLYDRSTSPARVLDDVERTHPLLTTAGRTVDNPRYEDATSFLAGRPAPEPDPLETGTPVIDLLGPTPVRARSEVAALAAGTALWEDEVAGLVYGVNEVVTNAQRHGRTPVTLRAWAATDRMVVVVTDGGPGPADPVAGLVPTGGRGAGEGLGLWLVHRLCGDVSCRSTPEGFSVRIRVGTPYSGRD